MDLSSYNSALQVVRAKTNFVLGNKPNHRLIAKTYLPQLVLATTNTGASYRVWTPHIWAFRDEVSCNTYLYAASSQYFNHVYPLYWPNIFPDGRVCYAMADTIPTLGRIPTDKYDQYYNADFTIDAMVSDFFTSIFHYFDFEPANIPHKLFMHNRYAYWTKDEYWGDEVCIHDEYFGDCPDGCEMDGSEPDESEIGMFMVDHFFQNLENASRAYANYAKPSDLNLCRPTREIFYDRCFSYWFYVRRLLANEAIFKEAAAYFAAVFPNTPLGESAVSTLEDA